MSASGGISRLMRRFAFSLGCIALIGYFSYHALHGDNGLIAWQALEQDAAQLREEIARAEARRALLERNVALMRPESLDPDMLDERARQALNYAHPNDITILRRAR